MRPLRLLLLLAALAATPSLPVGSIPDAAGGAEPSAAPVPDRLERAGLIVEPVDSDASAPTVAVPRAAARRRAPTPSFLHRFASVPVAAAASTDRSHLLDRVANPSTAPPRAHA